MLSKLNLQTIEDHELKISYLDDLFKAETEKIYITINSLKVFDAFVSIDISVILNDSDIENLLTKTANFLNINNLQGSFDIDKFYSKNIITAQMEIKEHVIKLQNNQFNKRQYC